MSLSNGIINEVARTIIDIIQKRGYSSVETLSDVNYTPKQYFVEKLESGDIFLRFNNGSRLWHVGLEKRNIRLWNSLAGNAWFDDETIEWHDPNFLTKISDRF